MTKLTGYAFGAIAAASTMIFTAAPAHAQSEPYVGQVMITAANYCPRGWLEADGQLLQINEHLALFSLLGSNYGGDGIRTFGLPDLKGRIPVSTGDGLAQGYASRPVSSGDENLPFTVLRYCIASQGIFPSRN